MQRVMSLAELNLRKRAAWRFSMTRNAAQEEIRKHLPGASITERTVMGARRVDIEWWQSATCSWPGHDHGKRRVLRRYLDTASDDPFGEALQEVLQAKKNGLLS